MEVAQEVRERIWYLFKKRKAWRGRKTLFCATRMSLIIKSNRAVVDGEERIWMKKI